MNIYLENLRLKGEHAILTESTATEAEKLEAKIALNEAVMAVDKYFNGKTVEKAKKHLKKNWKKYALGALAAGGAVAAYKNSDAIKAGAKTAVDKAGEMYDGTKKEVVGAVKTGVAKLDDAVNDRTANGAKAVQQAYEGGKAQGMVQSSIKPETQSTKPTDEVAAQLKKDNAEAVKKAQSAVAQAKFKEMLAKGTGNGR